MMLVCAARGMYNTFCLIAASTCVCLEVEHFFRINPIFELSRHGLEMGRMRFVVMECIAFFLLIMRKWIVINVKERTLGSIAINLW